MAIRQLPIANYKSHPIFWISVEKFVDFLASGRGTHDNSAT
jgi:hypothetical protein